MAAAAVLLVSSACGGGAGSGGDAGGPGDGPGGDGTAADLRVRGDGSSPGQDRFGGRDIIGMGDLPAGQDRTVGGPDRSGGGDDGSVPPADATGTGFDFPPGTMACTRATQDSCPLGTTCDIDGCDARSPGGCLPTPDTSTCPAASDPVCGCDGLTYATDCERLRAGVGRDHRGECAAGGGCGPSGQHPLCDDTHVCSHMGCGSNAPGTCAPLYASCPQDGARECGCDGKTYANACLRERAGVALDHAGGC
jgi:hypothetical protein